MKTIDYNELLNLAAEELLDQALDQLQRKDLEVLQRLESQLISEVSTQEEAKRNISLIFTTAYGENAEEMKQKMLLDYLTMIVEQTKTIKDLLQRYKAGDPTAIAAIEAQKDNPDVEKFLNYMEDNNTTSTDDVPLQSPQQTSH